MKGLQVESVPRLLSRHRNLSIRPLWLGVRIQKFSGLTIVGWTIWLQHTCRAGLGHDRMAVGEPDIYVSRSSSDVSGLDSRDLVEG